MSDRILADLRAAAEKAEREAALSIETAEQYAKVAEQQRAAAETAATDGRIARSLLAIVDGRTAALAPRDVTADEQALVLGVGPLRIGPAGTSADDLRLHLGTLRAVHENALHLARLCSDELRRREELATQEAGEYRPGEPDEQPESTTPRNERGRVVPPSGAIEFAAPGPAETADDLTAPGVIDSRAALTTPRVPYAELIGRVVRVHRTDGTRTTGRLESTTTQAIRLLVDLSGDYVDIPLMDVVDVRPINEPPAGPASAPEPPTAPDSGPPTPGPDVDPAQAAPLPRRHRKDPDPEPAERPAVQTGPMRALVAGLRGLGTGRHTTPEGTL